MKTAIYPGTFDPVTSGHLDILREAANLFDRVTVAVGVNPGKVPLFSLDERLEIRRRPFPPPLPYLAAEICLQLRAGRRISPDVEEREPLEPLGIERRPLLIVAPRFHSAMIVP